MKLLNSVNGNVPFEGDRTFRWQAIPANAKVLSATATVTPVDSGLDGPFVEVLDFSPAAINFGATRSSGGVRIAGAPPTDLAWVEVDFHTRRTIAGVTGSFNGATLQVDVGGGTYVEINRAGAFKTPSDASDFSLTGASLSVPGLTVAKLKLTQIATTPDLATVTVRSAPSNVSLRVGELPPFWTHVGEMTKTETTLDFAAVLQAALTTAKVANGFYDLSLIVHSDSIARLKIELEIDILAQQDVLSSAVPEVVLSFDASTLSKSTASELTIEVPVNSRAVADQTTLRVRGAFDETRVAYGPTGADSPTAAVEVSPTYSQSQIIELDHDIAAVAVDLLLEALTPSVRLQLDIRGDFDGKPDEIPLLPAPVAFSIEQRPDKGAVWTTVPLPAEFLFGKAGDKGPRYWLLLQSLEGTAVWSIQSVTTKTTGGLPVKNPVTVQRTRDGGLSWQESSPLARTVLNKDASQPFIALSRLRDKPKIFKMPIKLQIGSGAGAVVKSLERFQPLGRVDFTIDAELAGGINEFLQQTATAAVPEIQHLANADFERWDRLGDQMIARPPIEATVPINALAFAPDGTLAYVLDQDAGKDGFLLVVDVACNKIKEKRIALGLKNPRTFVVHPDGTRAYVTDGRNLRAVNLETSEALGAPSPITGDGETRAHSLALSADGQHLYWVTFNNTPENALRIVDTAELESSLRSLPKAEKIPALTGQSDGPIAVAVSPDEGVVYMLVDRGTAAAPVVTFVDTANFAAAGSPTVDVGRAASALALTPDGKQAVVPNPDDDTVSIIDTATRTAALIAVPPATTTVTGQLPKVVALSADGKYAYVCNQGSRSINVININSKEVIQSFNLTDGSASSDVVEAIAVSPQGDQLYVSNSGSNTISSIQFGLRLPSEWQRTSGEVFPLCLPDPFHEVAVLGSRTSPTAISQIVPVAESLPYEFSFWGIAAEPVTAVPPAIAEVLWLNSDCGLIKTDSLPIEVADIQGDELPLEFLTGLTEATRQRRTPLLLHRAQFSAPAGADQAEVRFSVGTAAAAMIDLAALEATTELVANGDFQQQKNGQLVGWNLAPDTATGFMVTASEPGLQLRNAGSNNAELTQLVAAESNHRFTLEFQGKASVGPAAALPRVELRWLKGDGSAAGDPTVLEIQPTGLDSAIASGATPLDSSKVEIHLIVPAKTTVDVKRVSFRYAQTTTVPVKFISEAPGDLTVSQVRIAFEKVPPQAPPIPPRGLCTATPPDREPGEKDDCCYCDKCEEETTMTDIEPVMTPAGRPAMRAKCAACGTDVINVGGPIVPGAMALPFRQTVVPRSVRVYPAALKRTSASAQAVAPRLTDIYFIGEKRAQQLTAIGIDSVQKLASATPAKVATVKFITLAMATQLIAQARAHLTGSR
jgi:DNA-binding beta-propeller fold protein YncE